MSPPLTGRILADSRDRPSWLKARSRAIGGSDAAKFAKVESWPLYLRSKLHNPFDGNAATIHGNDRERHMLAAFGLEQNTMLFASAANPRHVATPDAFKIGADGMLVTVQAKTSNKPLPARTPPDYNRQMQWEMYVMGAEESVLLWEHHTDYRPVNMEPESRLVVRDDAVITTLIRIADLVLEGLDAAEQFNREMRES